MQRTEDRSLALPSSVFHLPYSECRLQARIVKAVEQGKWRLVKNLQRLLAHSVSGRLMAVRRVTENRGKKTPGVDGAVWSTPEQKMNAVKRLSQKSYQAMPLR